MIGIFQGSEYARHTQGSEYAWVCSWIMLDWISPNMPKTEPKTTVQAK